MSSEGHVDRVMLDLETLGLEPGAAILSIGAVKFDTDGLGEEFHRNVGRAVQPADDDRIPMLPWCRDCWDQSGEGTKKERSGELPDQCQNCGSTEVFWI